MSQEVATQNAFAAPQQFLGGVNPFQQHTSAEGVSAGLFGRFNGNTGEFIVDGEAWTAGEEKIFELWSARLVWLGFNSDNKPVRGPEVLMREGKPLPDHDTSDPTVRWNKQIVVPVVSYDGTRIMYGSKADKPSRPIWRLMQAYGAKMGAQIDEQGNYKVPVIKINSRPFDITVREEGKPPMKATKYAEQFDIVGWRTIDDVEDIASAGEGSVDDVVSERGTEIAPGVEIMDTPKQPAAAQATPATGFRPVRRGGR